MYSKVEITGKIEVVTGLHIGGGVETGMIGAVDSPVVRDLHTHLPVIPGSSIKGKLRSLLAQHFGYKPNHRTHNDDALEVRRLFGSSERNNILQSRLQVADAFYCEETKERFDVQDIPYTEVKFENTINRQTSVANPRQMERVTRGSKFDFTIVYNVIEAEEVEEDFKHIQLALSLLEHDYLGGGGTRGNGRVKFTDVKIETVVGSYDSSKLQLK